MAIDVITSAEFSILWLFADQKRLEYLQGDYGLFSPLCPSPSACGSPIGSFDSPSEVCKCDACCALSFCLMLQPFQISDGGARYTEGLLKLFVDIINILYHVEIRAMISAGISMLWMSAGLNRLGHTHRVCSASCQNSQN